MAAPVGTVTFLFTDIQGSVRLWEEHPDAMRIALAEHDALLQRVIAEHYGYVFKTVGDAFCAAFATAQEAVAAAFTAQMALMGRTVADSVDLRVRMALHTGAVEERDNDYFGPPLNRVARLLDIGHGGQVLLSDVAHDLCRDSLPPGVTLKHLGEHRLRDLHRPETVFQLLHPALPDNFPPLKSLNNPALPNNLPQQITSFIGREREIEAVEAHLQAHRLVTLTGLGGCGKTRLSLQAAAERLEDFPDGVWFVELAALTDPGLVPQAAAQAVGVKETPDQPLTQTLAERLKTRRLLLVLDNCEHLLTACAQLTAALLHACPQVTILASSREPLGIAGEQTYRVPSLSQPDPSQTHLPTALSHYEAVRLFLDRTSLTRPDFQVTNENAPALASLCHRLEGIPLAIELAAARMRSLSVEEVNARLNERFRLLVGGNRVALPRHQTLRALMDWSYDLLNEKERTLLHRLSVFAGGWTLEAAERVCAGDIIEEWEVLDLLTSLTDKSLTIALEREGVTRYYFLETVRQYAAERLTERGAGDHIRERHQDYFLALAERAEPLMKGPQQAEWLERLETERDNLRAALRWRAGQPDDVQTSLRLAGALSWFWFIRGYWSEGLADLEKALSASGAQGATPERAKALNGAGSMALKLCDYPAARRFHEECLALRTELGDRRGVGSSYGNLGVVAEEQADYLTARTNYERCLVICREVGDPFNTAQTLCALGQVAQALGDYKEARALFEESLALSRETENGFGICGACGSLGTLSLDEGEYASARTLLEECLTLSRELGVKRGVAYSRVGLGKVALRQNDLVSARTLLQEGLSLFEELGARNGVADALDGLALLVATQADGVNAARLWGAAEALREALRAPLAPAHQAQRDRDADAARSVTGEEAFLTAWAEGKAMPLERTLSSIGL